MKRLFIIAAVAAVCAIAVTKYAQADDLLGNKSACKQVGDLIVQSGEMRDAGVPWDEVQSRLKELIEQARQNPHGFVNTEKEANFVIDGVRQVWSRKDEPSYVVAGEVFKTCVSKGLKAVML